MFSAKRDVTFICTNHYLLSCPDDSAFCINPCVAAGAFSTPANSLDFLNPRRLRDCFCDFLKNKRPDVQYDTVSRWEIPGSDFEPVRNDFYSKHSGMFAGTEYEDYPRGMYVGFTSNIDSEYLLDKLKLFYGSDKDEEVKKWEKETEPKMRIIKESEDKSDYTIFGLDSRKFEIVGGYEDAVALRKLMDKKHMDHDEIELIVGCLKLK